MYKFHLLFMVINANAVEYVIIAFQYLFIQQKLEENANYPIFID